MDNVGWGLQMTVVGMSLVFGLLAALWGLLTLVLRLDRPPDAPARAQEAAQAAAPGGEMPPDLVAAITVAVLTHKAARRRQAAPAMRSYWPGSLLYASRWVATGRARQNRAWRRGRP
jgi:Na+-transporting methylmalonyl-CoA/oxaloacetate decarboxylase gamma subunit